MTKTHRRWWSLERHSIFFSGFAKFPIAKQKVQLLMRSQVQNLLKACKVLHATVSTLESTVSDLPGGFAHTLTHNLCLWKELPSLPLAPLIAPGISLPSPRAPPFLSESPVHSSSCWDKESLHFRVLAASLCRRIPSPQEPCENG